jgi:hypothetical protein
VVLIIGGRRLPPPVGMSTRQSTPLIVALMISRWLVRNEFSPKNSRFNSFSLASHENRALHLGWPTCVAERGDGECGREKRESRLSHHNFTLTLARALGIPGP